MFLMNYIVENLDIMKLSVDGFNVDELMIMVKAYKKYGKMREAMVLLQSLLRKKDSTISENRFREAMRGLDFRLALATQD